MAIAESGKKNDIAVTDRLARILMGLDVATDVGPGSGNHGHKGILGHHGGSHEDPDDDSDFFSDDYAVDGGPGSGNFNHAGIPGQVGGSAAENGGRVIPRNRERKDRPVNQNFLRASYNDVTKEYINNATPGQGKFIIDPGVDVKKRIEDIQMAKWIHSTLGGDIRVLEENQEVQGVKNPDYEWRDRFWELKTPEEFTYNAINKRTQAGLRQIKTNPGGIIMDLSDHNGSFEDAENAISDRIRNSARFDVDVIVLRKGDEYRILRYKTSSAKAEH